VRWLIGKLDKYLRLPIAKSNSDCHGASSFSLARSLFPPWLFQVLLPEAQQIKTFSIFGPSEVLKQEVLARYSAVLIRMFLAECS
jgi:hypothetical protein